MYKEYRAMEIGEAVRQLCKFLAHGAL
jgi:hypothetical protein